MQVEAKIRANYIVTQITSGSRCIAGFFHALVGFEYFAMHIVVTNLYPHRIAGDRHALDQQMRVIAHDVSILAGTRLAFIGIAYDVFFSIVILGHEAPLQARRKSRATAAAQRRQLDLGNDRIWRHFFSQHFAQRLIAADLQIIFQRPGLVEIHRGENNRAFHDVFNTVHDLFNSTRI